MRSKAISCKEESPKLERVIETENFPIIREVLGQRDPKARIVLTLNGGNPLLQVYSERSRLCLDIIIHGVIKNCGQKSNRSYVKNLKKSVLTDYSSPLSEDVVLVNKFIDDYPVSSVCDLGLDFED